jgi:hypothetical protein
MGLRRLRKDFWYTTGIAGRTVAGAEARLILLAFIGPAKAVLLLQSVSEWSFSAAYEVVS